MRQKEYDKLGLKATKACTKLQMSSITHQLQRLQSPRHWTEADREPDGTVRVWVGLQAATGNTG